MELFRIVRRDPTISPPSRYYIGTSSPAEDIQIKNKKLTEFSQSDCFIIVQSGVLLSFFQGQNGNGDTTEH